MDIETLSKSQLLLLTLLVSFVTSTATGVLTVSLLEETPQTITQTVNRVVERTIERVEQTENGGAAVVTRETTVVVKEEDVLGDSIQEHVKRLVALHVGTTTTQALGSGIIIPGESLIATAGKALPAEGQLLVKLPSGTVVPGSVAHRSESGVALIKLTLAEGQVFPKVTTYEFMTEGVRRGQSVSALSGRGAVLTGIISLIEGAKIETNLEQLRIPYGATLISTFGDVIGMHVATTEGTSAQFISAQTILESIAEYKASLAAEQANNATI